MPKTARSQRIQIQPAAENSSRQVQNASRCRACGVQCRGPAKCSVQRPALSSGLPIFRSGSFCFSGIALACSGSPCSGSPCSSSPCSSSPCSSSATEMPSCPASGSSRATSGQLRQRSHFETALSVTCSASASAFCVIPRASRRRRMSCPVFCKSISCPPIKIHRMASS